MLDAGWDQLVEILDRGGYTRYDFKTARKLLNVNQALMEQYGGDLNALHQRSSDASDLARRLKKHGRGIGEVTVNIFLRKLRGIWHKAEPLRLAAVDSPILSLHWGPNMVFRPSRKFQSLARAAIGMGWEILFSFSAHVFQGIEMYRGWPIFYAAGGLVDDYYVDPNFKNDHQLLFEMALTHSELRHLQVHPVFIEWSQTRLATGAQSEEIVSRMKKLRKQMRTEVQPNGDMIWIAGSEAGCLG